MSSDHKFLLRFVTLSMRVARRGMSEYACRRSRHDFTQRQLVTCLVLRAVLKLTYRGVVEFLAVAPEIREAMGIDKVPHYTTLQKLAAKPGVIAMVESFLAEIIREVGDGAPGSIVEVGDVAMDSTGLSKTLASAHFLSRSGRGSQRGIGRYIKVSVMILCTSLLPCALTVGLGPRSDTAESPRLLAQASRVVKPRRLFADRGFDSERLHEFCREEWRVKSWVPPVIRTADGTIKTRYRARMTKLPKGYGRRWAVESFFSGLKRTCGAGLTARADLTLNNEAALRVLAYAIRR